MDGDVAVAGLVFQETDALHQDVIDQDLLFGGLHAAGKAQQAVGDLLDPLHVVLDFFEGVPVLLKIGAVGHIFLFEQVLHPARFFGDDRQGVVDLVGHPGGHLPQGGHFAFMDQDLVAPGLLQVALPQAVQNLPGVEHRAQDNEANAHERQQPHQVLGPEQRLQGLPGVFPDNQDPLGDLDRGGRKKTGHAFIGDFFDPGADDRGEIRPGRRLQQVTTKAGLRLQQIFPVDEVGVAAIAGLGGQHDALDDVGINGGPQYPAAVFLPDQDRNNKVGDLPEAQENVAHVGARVQHRVKPGGVPVVNLFQDVVVWPHIGQVVAVFVNHPQVDVRTGAGVHDV